MPHFFAKSLENISYPAKCDKFSFIFEAKSLNNNHSIILAKSPSEEILLLKQQRDNKILIKYNKHLKVSSKEAIKQALSEYAKLTNADIISHNLALKNKQERDNQYLLNIKDLLFKIDTSKKEAKNVIIEIGFGSGRHLLNLSKDNKEAVCIGIEIYRPAILQLLRQIELQELKNIFIINADCRILFDILPTNSVDRIYMHFPVPWEKNEQKRVLSKAFLQNTLRILKPNCFFELRTDSLEYATFARDLARDNKLDISFNKNTKSSVVSKYEARWIRQKKDIFTICFLKHSSEAESHEHSSLGMHSNDLEDFGSSQTPSLVSLPKSSKNIESTTANIRMLGGGNAMESLDSKLDSTNLDSNDSTKQVSNSLDSTLCVESNNKNNSHEAKRSATLKACSGVKGDVKGEKGRRFAQVEPPSPPLKNEGIENNNIVGDSKELEDSTNLDSRLDSPLNSKDSIDSKLDSTLDSNTLEDSNNLAESTLDSRIFARDSTDSLETPQDSSFFIPNLNIKTLLESKNKKLYKEEYFLHIKDIYEFENGYIIFIVFGSYFAPNSMYLVLEGERAKFLGEFIPTRANISALHLLGVL